MGKPRQGAIPRRHEIPGKALGLSGCCGQCAHDNGEPTAHGDRIGLIETAGSGRRIHVQHSGPGEMTQAPFHPITDHRIANLFGHDKTDLGRALLSGTIRPGALVKVGMHHEGWPTDPHTMTHNVAKLGGVTQACRGRQHDAQADSSERPLRRRAARMARPARLLIRARKPWVRARRRLLGWYVRLLTRRAPEYLSVAVRIASSTHSRTALQKAEGQTRCEDAEAFADVSDSSKFTLKHASFPKRPSDAACHPVPRSPSTTSR